ncbi:hypothetical protein B0H13DRAFT_2348928 [Mycena leptocephala]|nr:hypothetical protein B0H13DRAFT_2348928 [Mycena leptocephala]
MNTSSRSLRSSSPVYVFLLDDDLEWVTSYTARLGLSCVVLHSASASAILAVTVALRFRVVVPWPAPLPVPPRAFCALTSTLALGHHDHLLKHTERARVLAPSPLPTKSLNPPASFIAPLRLAVDAADGLWDADAEGPLGVCVLAYGVRLYCAAVRSPLSSCPPLRRHVTTWVVHRRWNTVVVDDVGRGCGSLAPTSNIQLQHQVPPLAPQRTPTRPACAIPYPTPKYKPAPNPSPLSSATPGPLPACACVRSVPAASPPRARTLGGSAHRPTVPRQTGV